MKLKLLKHLNKFLLNLSVWNDNLPRNLPTIIWKTEWSEDDNWVRHPNLFKVMRWYVQNPTGIYRKIVGNKLHNIHVWRSTVVDWILYEKMGK